MKIIIKSRSTILFNIFLVICAFFIVKNVNATSYDISIEPSFLRVFLKPSKTFYTDFSIRSKGDPGEYQFEIREVELNGEDKKLTFKTYMTQDPLIEIESIKQSDKTIVWQKTEDNNSPVIFISSPTELSLKIGVKSSSSGVLGEHHFMLLAKKVSRVASTQSMLNVSLEPAAGIMIFVSVTDGSVDIDGGIDTLTLSGNKGIFGNTFFLIDNSWFIRKLPVILRVYNKEKYTMPVQASLSLKGLLGEKITYDLQPTYVVPFTSRLLLANQSIDCKQREVTCKPDASLLLRGLPFGYFKLSADVTYGLQTEKTYKSISYLILPFWLIIIIGGVVILLFMSVRTRK